MSTRCHLWFSVKAKRKGHGTAIYRKDDGTEVEVTCADTSEKTNYGWDDAVYVGEGIYARTGQRDLVKPPTAELYLKPWG